MTLLRSPHGTRRKAVWGPKRILAALLLVTVGFVPNAAAQGLSGNVLQGLKAKPASPSAKVKNYKLDDEVSRRKHQNPAHITSVIVTLVPGAQLPPQFKKFERGGRLGIINGQVLDLPNGIINQLETRPEIFRVHYNRPAATHNFRTTLAVGARSLPAFGVNGAGIGIAVIDSGIAAWHDDLTSKSTTQYPYGNQRVSKFVDFVNGRTLPYDDNGHGTHVAGTIGGHGYDSWGAKAGVAPAASLVSLKVLDQYGRGTIGNLIAALNWVAANHQTYNIRVVNMSVGAGVSESYWTDPLTLAAKAVTERGITVVTAAGNLGKNAAGAKQWGGITAPGNAPWVLTVGASTTMGTFSRGDDSMAGFSSSGPTHVDFSAKPDLVAPGVGTVSLAAPGSMMYATKAAYLIGGSISLGYKPYLTLSGTSMAAPVVSGTIALMLQVNPNLTPNLIKAILQYTSRPLPETDPLRQGTGQLDALGAVRLSYFHATARPGDALPSASTWSKQIIWGNHLIAGGYLDPQGNAWALDTVWGDAHAANGFDNVIWGTNCGDFSCDNVIWGTNDGDNVIWGTNDGDNVIWGTNDDDNVIWGTGSDYNVVWGTDCGGADCDNVIWGTSDFFDNVIWGTADEGDNVIWGTSLDLFDNVIWGTADDSGLTWATSDIEETIFPDDPEEVIEPASEDSGLDLIQVGTSLISEGGL